MQATVISASSMTAYRSIIQSAVSLTSADFEGEISGTLLAPTSCLIGAMSVLVHDMYT